MKPEDGPTRLELRKLSLNRLEEAKCLHNNGFYDSAIYIAGYSIELALKAVICKKLSWTHYTPKVLRADTAKVFKAHEFLTLSVLGGVWFKIEKETDTNPIFKAHWAIISKWSELKRYEAIGSNDKTKSEEFIEAIENPVDGVLTFLKKRW